MSGKLETDVALIADRLESVKEDIHETLGVLKEHVEEDRQQFRRIDGALRGKDSENPGLFTRVDRLEGAHRRNTRRTSLYLSILGGVLITVIGTLAVSYFKGGN